MQSVAKTSTRGKSKVTRHIFKLVVFRIFKIALTICVINFLLIAQASGNEPTSADSKDKSGKTSGSSHKRKWLIPVGAAAGFGVGLLIGFQAYDQAINAEEKIWTSSIVGGAIGGVSGWLLSRHMSRDSKEFGWRNQNDVQELQIHGVRKSISSQFAGSFSDKLRQLYSENMNSMVRTSVGSRQAKP